MNRSISISRKIALAYSEVCKPLCKELGRCRKAHSTS